MEKNWSHPHSSDPRVHIHDLFHAQAISLDNFQIHGGGFSMSSAFTYIISERIVSFHRTKITRILRGRQAAR
jgi:hypothetical protein